MPVREDRQYRGMILPLRIGETQTRRLESEAYVEGYAAVFDTPYVLYEDKDGAYTERILRGAFDGADMSDVIMQYDHTGPVMARLSNQTLGLELDDKGLFVYADLSKSRAARALYEEIDAGLVTKMSWAFRLDPDGLDYDPAARMFTVKRVRKVFDVSAVSLPANDGTEIAARALHDGVIERGQRETLLRQIRLDILKAKMEGR